ncbi:MULTISPECIES: MarR family winged helix-turn-helix transcriptional regulator [unclassified Microbacterium]|jgi:DNA-binding MarR family transcriptional regulator|uniref:MarR family winged helix-turn-helix transcriptional regulator n=1 Tax=unclassified Microbacterium TaxID=2609290 RepID=UPI000C2C3DE6|nr:MULTISPECIES: MarR family winged helix-turn-helix transcriptional regulator [unclassified Microbacterium]
MATHLPLSDAVLAQATAQGLVTEPLARTIDRDSYSPALLGLLNNVLVWGGSRVFNALHDVGANEWRVLSALGNHPGATARDLCEILGINKSIASKSVGALVASGHVGQADGRRTSRHLFLTTVGAALHDQLMPIALRRTEILQHRLSDDEVVELNRLLSKMLESAADLQEYERALLASGPTQAPSHAPSHGPNTESRTSH